MPDGYGVRGFVRDNLPIIPDTFTLVPRQVRTEKGCLLYTSCGHVIRFFPNGGADVHLRYDLCNG